MKKLFIVSLACSLLFLLNACSNENSTDKEGKLMHIKFEQNVNGNVVVIDTSFDAKELVHVEKYLKSLGIDLPADNTQLNKESSDTLDNHFVFRFKNKTNAITIDVTANSKEEALVKAKEQLKINFEKGDWSTAEKDSIYNHVMKAIVSGDAEKGSINRKVIKIEKEVVKK